MTLKEIDKVALSLGWARSRAGYKHYWKPSDSATYEVAELSFGDLTSLLLSYELWEYPLAIATGARSAIACSKEAFDRMVVPFLSKLMEMES